MLTTERLRLCPPAAGDRETLFAIVSNAQTRRFLGPSESAADFFGRFQRGAGSWLLHGYGMFMVRLRETDALIGNCGVFHSYRGLGEDFDDEPEAGWIIGADHAGQGLASEAMAAVFDWFDKNYGPRRVVCMISEGNAPSVAVAEKFGFMALREASLPAGDLVRLFERPASHLPIE